MKLGITLLLLTCLTTAAEAAWFEYKPSKQKKVQQLNDGQTDGGKPARYQVSRTSTGPVSIASIDPDGKFIMLENTSSGPNRRDVNLEGWSVERVIDGKNKYKYTFRKYTIKATKRLKIYGRGFAAQARIGDAVMYDQTSWGTGNNTTTVLLNDKGETSRNKSKYNDYTGSALPRSYLKHTVQPATSKTDESRRRQIRQLMSGARKRHHT